MQATKKRSWFSRGLGLACLCCAALLEWGCTPPGPAALLRGDDRLRKGQPAQAVEELRLAVRLMPQEPRAWNHLGLAYQAAGQPRLAIEAYRQALVRDRSNLVFHAHYNLGCVFFEQNQMPAAIEELRSFLMLSNSLPARLKLAQAHQRLRQWNEAENNFQAVLRQQPRSAEALNGAGIVRSQLGRTHEAVQYFEAAVQADPKSKYPPALFNLATLYAQQLGLRTLAMQRYREYLSIQPAPPEAAAAEAALHQLEASLAPVIAPLPPNPLTQTFAWTPRTNLVSSNAATLAPPKPVSTTSVAIATQRTAGLLLSRPPRAVVETNFMTRTNALPPEPVVKTPEVAPPAATARTSAPPALVLTPSHRPPVVPGPTTPPVPPTVPAPIEPASAAAPPVARAPTPVVTNPGPLTVVQWSDEPPPKPAQDLVEGAARSLGETPAAVESNSTHDPRTPNPPTVLTALTPPAPAVASVKPTSRTAGVAPASKPPRPRPAFPRYPRRPATAPVAGDRPQALRLYQQAVQAQQAGHWETAQQVYWEALQADPSFFEAAANAGFAAYQRGDWAQTLACYEIALALKPDALNTRYSFALALAQGGYAVDAAEELEKMLAAHPDETRAHLALGNLQAEKLGEPELARAHFQKVLELDPANPQASAVRTWLATHP